jgi:hypothetical protein
VVFVTSFALPLDATRLTWCCKVYLKTEPP